MSAKAEQLAAVPSPRPASQRQSPLRAHSVLLASHDTEGSRAAERAALDAVIEGGRLHHLVIVPQFWQSITGDGWRINASTEHAFCDYVEAQIEREILAHLTRVHETARSRGIHYSASSRHGLRSRINLDKLAARLRVPLVVIPHPGRASSAAP
jgi:hypothetical protein